MPMEKYTHEARLGMTEAEQRAAWERDQAAMAAWDADCAAREDREFAAGGNDPLTDLARAEDSAAALLAELEAKDRANAVAGTVRKPDPVAGVAAPGEGLQDALSSSFRPVNLDKMRENTLASSKTVDFAQKIRDAQKFKGNH